MAERTFIDAEKFALSFADAAATPLDLSLIHI